MYDIGRLKEAQIQAPTPDRGGRGRRKMAPKVKQGFAFHVHHDKLWEWCTSYEERRDYIIHDKPASEQELRMRLFKMIPEERIPLSLRQARAAHNKAWTAYNKAGTACNKAGTAYNKAVTAYNKAGTAHNKAWTAYNKAVTACAPEMEALHKELCPDCPWNGQTIFSPNWNRPTACRGA